MHRVPQNDAERTRLIAEGGLPVTYLGATGSATIELPARARAGSVANAPQDLEAGGALLTTARDSEHGLTLCSDGAPLVIEIMPRGEMILFAGHRNLAKQCEELLAHAKVD